MTAKISFTRHSRSWPRPSGGQSCRRARRLPGDDVMRTVRGLLWAWPLAATLAGCPARDISPVDTTQVGEVQKDIPISTDIDILFLIDNSSSTFDKQQLFANNFPNFITALDSFPNGRPNVHIGV